jgi:Predicted AdoMet-dependent methyltransferase
MRRFSPLIFFPCFILRHRHHIMFLLYGLSNLVANNTFATFPLLTAEGYEGYGIDLRARISWSHSPESTQERLRVHALDPTSDEYIASESDSYLKPGVFIVGNHADELTPWVPVLSTIHNASGYLSIPCCSWAFDAKFERSSTSPYPVPDAHHFANSLNLGYLVRGIAIYHFPRYRTRSNLLPFVEHRVHK